MSLSVARIHKSTIYLQGRNREIFRFFLVQVKIAKSTFEINCPLAQVPSMNECLSKTLSQNLMHLFCNHARQKIWGNDIL